MPFTGDPFGLYGRAPSQKFRFSSPPDQRKELSFSMRPLEEAQGYLEAVFDRYWEERSCVAAARTLPLEPREGGQPRKRRGEPLALLFCAEVQRAVSVICSPLESEILWGRPPAPGEVPQSWSSLERSSRRHHSTLKRLYRGAADKTEVEFRRRRLRPRAPRDGFQLPLMNCSIETYKKGP